MSTSIDPFVTLNTPVERRFYPRITPSAAIYVAFGPNNLGTLLNVSENGFQVVTPTRLDVNSVYRIFLSLDGASNTIAVSVRTIWTADSQNSSGIQLLDLAEQDRQQIRGWVTLQTSQDEGLEHWFSPKKSEPSLAAAEPFLDASPEVPPPPAPAPKPSSSTTTQSSPKPAESAIESEFPPMPLPIHGEFTYQPLSEREQKILRRRERKSRSRSRSPVSQFVLWTLFMAAICGAAGWSFRHQLSDRFLHRPTEMAKQSTQPADNVTSGAPDTTVQSAAEPPSSLDANSTIHDVNRDAENEDADHNADATSVPAATSNALPPSVAATRRPALKVSGSKPNLRSLPNRPAPPDAPEVPRTYVADSVSSLTATNTVNVARIPAPVTVPAATVSGAPAPAAPTSNAAPPPPTTIRSAADAPAHRSAIVGSIDNSSRSSNSSAAAPSGVAPSTTVASSAPPADPRQSMVRGNSFAARNPNPSSSYAPSTPVPANPATTGSAVIQMDVPQARPIEITPPKGLTKDLTASYVNLPGQRVLRSGSLTIHIERSVRVPGDHIPGERWLWRGHKTVIPGELASRVDPQVSQLAVPYGSITVLATVDKDGYVSNVKPLYGSLAFLPNVAAAIRNWHYQPTYLDNKPADTQAQIEIDFHPPGARTARP